MKCPNCGSQNVVCITGADINASATCGQHRCNDCNTDHAPYPERHVVSGA